MPQLLYGLCLGQLDPAYDLQPSLRGATRWELLRPEVVQRISRKDVACMLLDASVYSTIMFDELL
jgi:hypothetical protein